jgi:hypothetical protein
LLMRGMHRRRMLYSLGVERRLGGQSMVQRLYKAKSSMFVHGRLILRSGVTTVDIDPSITAPKAILVWRVVLVVHADLGHCGIVHSLEESSAPKLVSTARSTGRWLRTHARWMRRRRWCSWLRQSSRTADCMHDKQWFLGCGVNI